MSKLSELIEKFCADGVEDKELKDILTIKNGRDYKTFPAGDIPVYGSGGIIAYVDRFSYDKPSVLIPRKGSIDKLYYVETPFWNVDTIFYTDIDTSKVLPRYVYHCLKREHLEKLNIAGGVPSLTQAVLNKVTIPLPPLEVQEEIVRILDKFTDLVYELTRELTRRKKQYEYYRDKLLTFGDEVEWKKLGEIAEIVRGASPRPINKFITNDETGENWIKIGDIDFGSKYVIDTKEKITQEGALKSRMVLEGDFILSNSMSFGRPYIVKKKGFIHDGWLKISNFKKYILPDYLYYLLSSSQQQNDMKKKASFGGAVSNLNSDIVKSLNIPIPSLSEQERIVNILDKFDKLCNDICEGIPAEIEARQKQYEYYRDRLLTF